MTLILNGFEVDADLTRLMRRTDWPGRRTDTAWLERFPAHPVADVELLPFVDLCAPEHALLENSNIRSALLAVLHGKPHSSLPPGDFDPTAGYLIGFTDFVDSSICVDLRPREPRVIYECHGPTGGHFATAFQTLREFIEFFETQHGA